MSKYTIISKETRNRPGARNNSFSKKGKSLFFQPKLSVSQPNDIYEQQADAMADKVMRMPSNNNGTAFTRPITVSSIQRKCASCAEEEIQRKKENDENVRDSYELDNYIVSLNSKGETLPASTRGFFEPRFGYDFSNVKVHTDPVAANSAQSIHALAYTSGNNIVFNSSQYAPNTDNGKRLLAHELTHVVQQRNNNTLSTHLIQKMDLSPLIPTYSQIGDSCGAASIVAALTIWHNERRTASGPNSVIATTCNIILSHMVHNRSVIIRRIEAAPRVTVPANEFFDDLSTELTAIRDRAIAGARNINESDFQHLGLYLAFMFNSDGRGGMSSSDIDNLLNALQLSGRTQMYSNLDEILDSSLISSLGNDGVAQVNWYAGTPASFTPHAFILGRLNDGNWYIYDQGQTPPFRIQEPTYIELKMSFLNSINTGRSWLLRSYPTGAPLIIPTPWTGVRILSRRAGAMGIGMQNLIMPLDFLAEVDAGAFTTGERLNCMGFAGAEYDFDRAKAMFREYKRTHSDYNYSGLIIEMPSGVFTAYTANTVSDANVGVRAIDVADSAGGKLERPIYFHAYLLLCSNNTCAIDFFTVY